VTTGALDLSSTFHNKICLSEVAYVSKLDQLSSSHPCHTHMHCLLLTGTSHVHHAYITIHHLNLGTPIEGLSHGQFYYYLYAFISIFLIILFSFYFISSYLQQISLTWCNFQGPDSRVEHRCLGCLHWGQQSCVQIDLSQHCMFPESYLVWGLCKGIMWVKSFYFCIFFHFSSNTFTPLLLSIFMFFPNVSVL